MSAAMMPSTVEFKMRSRNSVARRSSLSRRRARLTSRKAKMAASCSERMPIDATETTMLSPDVVTSSRSKLSIGSDAAARVMASSSSGRYVSGTIRASFRPTRPSRA